VTALVDLVAVDGYLIVEASRWSNGDVRVARLVGSRKRMPYLQRDQVAIHVRIRLPRRVFGPTRIYADVTVEDDTVPPMTVTLEPAS
jgi:hypothetical protein